MDRTRFLDLLAAESEALASAASAAGPDAAVPSCPGWTVADLLAHCIGGDGWARAIVEQDEPTRVDYVTPPDLPEGEARVAQFRDTARGLLDTLRATDPAKSVWTFGPDRTTTFWIRRRTIETAIHRYDAQLAAGRTVPVDADLAADGVDEFFEVFLKRLQEGLAGLGGTVHLHCTDTAGEWLLAPGDAGLVVTREHAKGDVAARGTASDLLLWIWGRVPVGSLEVFGDAALLDRFRAATRI